MQRRIIKVVNAMPSPPLSADMKPLDGLVVAIKKELEAMQMYSQLAGLSTETEQKFLFTQLANMESGHKATAGGSLHQYGIP